MKTKKYIIQINQPCDQDWHKMTNCEQGRFCSQCSKTVHDFSQYSDKQIIEFLTKQKGNVCGRMKETQLNQVISFGESTNKKPRFLTAIAGIILAITGNTISAQNIQSEEISITNSNKQNNPPSQTNVVTNVINKTLFGTVVDSANKEIIIQAIVILKELNLNTVTDYDGNFSIQLPVDFVEDSVLLEARYVGYFPFEIRISSKNLHLPIKIELVRSIDLNEVAVGGLICVIEKPKWYQFWKKRNKKLKH